MVFKHFDGKNKERWTRENQKNRYKQDVISATNNASFLRGPRQGVYCGFKLGMKAISVSERLLCEVRGAISPMGWNCKKEESSRDNTYRLMTD